MNDVFGDGERKQRKGRRDGQTNTNGWAGQLVTTGVVNYQWPVSVTF